MTYNLLFVLTSFIHGDSTSTTSQVLEFPDQYLRDEAILTITQLYRDQNDMKTAVDPYFKVQLIEI